MNSFAECLIFPCDQTVPPKTITKFWSLQNLSVVVLFALFELSLPLAVLVHSQNQSGFISIDCGLVGEPNYTDETTSINYTSDANFISTGITHSISSKYKPNTLKRQFRNVRSFPEGTRNCYTLNAPQGSGSKYLVRAMFMYGNYDGEDSLPKFDIYLGTKWWDSVMFQNASDILIKEIIYAASTNYVHVCLFNTNNGTPFVSVLELRVLHSDAYLVSSLELLARYDLGLQDGELVRYPDDIYDRIWTPHNSKDWERMNTSLPVGQGSSSSVPSYSFITVPPSTVMRTAATPANVRNDMEFHFLPRYNASTYYTCLYFAETQKLQANQIREFNTFLNGGLINSDPVSPPYLETEYYIQATTEPWFDIWINKTGRSTLPPIFNAIEIYMVKDLSQSQTQQTDVDAIMNIKSFYGIKRNWQGDPCTPQAYLWDGLNCSYDRSGPPMITSLNLSSGGLTGNIAPDISNLKSIEYLDLSNNSLVGDVPSFLSQLQFLRVLDLEGNQLSGTIPAELYERSKNGSLKLSFGGNPNLCSSEDSCKSSKAKVVIPLVSSLAGVFILLTVTIAFCIFRRKQEEKLSAYSKINKELKLKKQQLTYAEVSSITNNFEKVVGKGAFGTVYHGFLGNTQVAVKMLTPSAQGYQQFQAEYLLIYSSCRAYDCDSQAKLLATVHHKRLIALIGYCDDGSNIALIYEYMANSDLAKHLSEKNENILDWKQRLQIAVDAAEGLEYLHTGCKPSIVHRDVKSKNILLNENFRGKIADFGLSKIFADEGDTHISTVIAGTPGYLDPEYSMSNRLNEKSDVYSFGIVLLEIITGQPAIAKTEEKPHIVQWVNLMLPESKIDDIVDSRLQGNFDTDSAGKALDTAMACVVPSSLNRPTMSNVVMELRQCLAMEIARGIHSKIDFSFGGISGESSLAR
ncbi:probable LRR receptor-like serine/threonine-protein kinase At1g05700 [Prosopis cineraria]|uniref:probable LRR receptor-like serine/threonine-protein kinase At1g05700 n=1 Tax=Prosopis cineraria TaxID=364024 RepID=UPI00240F6958|nr:probable LRR receptor-like serine/threonine-protein kinase At1g05700 [Prosopis cineraria]